MAPSNDWGKSIDATNVSANTLGGGEDKKLSMPDEPYAKPSGHPLLLTGTKTAIERQFSQISRSFHILKDGGYRRAPSGEYSRLLLIKEATP